MNKSLRQKIPRLKDEFRYLSEQAQQAFEPQIEEAAKQLYKQLQTQPALLNTLRATRASADAAGIALTIKSGGLAPTDLILAPAMLSVTSLLTESALGQYLEKTKKSLKEKQRIHIRTNVIDSFIAQQLINLADDLDNRELFSERLESELEAVVLAEHPSLI